MVTLFVRTALCSLSIIGAVNAADYSNIYTGSFKNYSKNFVQPFMAASFSLVNTTSFMGTSLVRAGLYTSLIAKSYKNFFSCFKEYPVLTGLAATAGTLYFYDSYAKCKSEEALKEFQPSATEVKNFLNSESILKENSDVPTVNVLLTVTKAPVFLPHFVRSWIYNTSFFTSSFKTSTALYTCQWKKERHKVAQFKSLLSCSAGKDALRNGFIYSLSVATTANSEQLHFTTYDKNTLEDYYQNVQTSLNSVGRSEKGNSYWLSIFSNKRF